MRRPPHRAARSAVLLLAMLLGLAGGALAQQQDSAPAPVDPTQASQIEPPARRAGTGRAYLDESGRPPAPRASLTGSAADQISRHDSHGPASQISARGAGGSGMAQLSRADLEASLAQLSSAERRVLLQAIEGSDICDAPPAIPAIVALCLTRLETRAGDFAGPVETTLSAEDRLLRGDLESSTLPSIGQVIERLARGGASSGDLSNQAIAAIALGTNAPQPAQRSEETPAETPGLGEEAQALINALINQLGGRTP
jgi:hypothetical protein